MFKRSNKITTLKITNCHGIDEGTYINNHGMSDLHIRKFCNSMLNGYFYVVLEDGTIYKNINDTDEETPNYQEVKILQFSHNIPHFNLPLTILMV